MNRDTARDLAALRRCARCAGSGSGGSSSWWLLLVAVTVAAMVIGARVMVSDHSGHHEATPASGAAYVKNIPAAYRITAERVAPLAAGMSVAPESSIAYWSIRLNRPFG